MVKFLDTYVQKWNEDTYDSLFQQLMVIGSPKLNSRLREIPRSYKQKSMGRKSGMEEFWEVVSISAP